MVPRRKGAHTFYETYGFEKASYGLAFDLVFSGYDWSFRREALFSDAILS
ncbi:hypothetical protein PHG01_01095 [Streptococcus mutans PKUSS-HG01]|nr:hypothetical protein SMU63_02986 [Streptococcus mutans T4]EMC52678.1 hypothetical protein SMU104_01705 [Streptococcus mutans SA41]ESS17440.1 hypothetical protein PHG01_01095 [Streptococcus mutans PKUSS-HG01]ESS18148.1 hypothetical protein PLG01_01055 [Streptococcus mutans PKUSS-LG01]